MTRRDPDEGKRSIGQRMRRSLGQTPAQRASLANHPILRPVARHLLAPHLWHLQRESAARGTAIGIFWAFAIPFGQIVVAAAHCVWWRANIPIAAAITLITNPFTIAFWLWLAYETGTLIVDAPPLVMPGQGTNIREWLQDVGGPVVLGMGIFAVGGAAAGYVLVKLGWKLRLVLKRRRRASLKTRQSKHD